MNKKRLHRKIRRQLHEIDKQRCSVSVCLVSDANLASLKSARLMFLFALTI